jgi:hypothetical protein
MRQFKIMKPTRQSGGKKTSFKTNAFACCVDVKFACCVDVKYN